MSQSSTSHVPQTRSMKRAASDDADSEAAAQRARLTAPAQLGALSPAQRCAHEVIAAAFSFLHLSDVLSASLSCHAWYTAAEREKPREVKFSKNSTADFARLLSSRSPLRRHVSILVPPADTYLTPALLRRIRALPGLTALEATLDAAAMNRLRAQGPVKALADLRAALPLRLREVTLRVPSDIDIAGLQLLIDALPVVTTLDSLDLEPLHPSHGSEESDQTAALSLEPLLQLPQLANLHWNIGDLTLSQLAVVKQIESLRVLSSNFGRWSAEQLSFLSQPPHRLDQLETINLFHTDVSAAHMTALAQLSGITHIDFVQSVQLAAFRMLPRLPRLQRLGFNLPEFAIRAVTDWATLQSTLNACSTVTCLTLFGGYCSEAVGERLLHSLPQLQQLRLVHAVVPSLRFLRWAPLLDDLELVDCCDVRPGHVLALGKVAPRLKILGVRDREGLLDEFERQALTPPHAVGLPNLQMFLHEVRADANEEEEEEEEEDEAGAVEDVEKGKEEAKDSVE